MWKVFSYHDVMMVLRAHFIFKCIFVNKKIWILIKISLKFVPKGLIDINPASVWIMAWCRIGVGLEGAGLGMGSANGRRLYNVTSSLIDVVLTLSVGWAHDQNDACFSFWDNALMKCRLVLQTTPLRVADFCWCRPVCWTFTPGVLAWIHFLISKSLIYMLVIFTVSVMSKIIFNELECGHMSVKASQITDTSTICQIQVNSKFTYKIWSRPPTPDQNVYHARTHFHEERGNFSKVGANSRNQEKG